MRLNKATITKRFLPLLNGGGGVILGWLATSMARLMSMTVAVLLLGYLLYVTAWKPVVKEVELPPWVLPVNPAINVEVLQEINAQRVARVQSVRRSFTSFESLFALQRAASSAPSAR